MGDQLAFCIVGVAFQTFVGAFFLVEQAKVVVVVVGDLTGWVDDTKVNKFLGEAAGAGFGGLGRYLFDR